MRKLLHPASTYSCDIVEEHLSTSSIQCHLAGEDLQMVRSKDLFLLEKEGVVRAGGCFPARRRSENN